MRGSSLDPTTRSRDEALDGRSVKPTSKLLLLGLDARNHRDCEEILIHPSVQIKDLAHFRVGFFFGEMCGVAFLPEEFSCTEERLGVLEFPTDDAVPLVEFQREITMTLDPFGVVGVHGRFRSRTDGDGFLEV
ncbi:hypothetical protein PM082_012108 [Marasmius tenuissimus]|nr:hypothetical protein PM082_012108 [Marasmius tenuissimus]